MESFVLGNIVNCILYDEDKYGRLVVECFVDGKNKISSLCAMGSRLPIGKTRTILLRIKNTLRGLKLGFGKASLLNHGNGEGVKIYLRILTTNLIDAKSKAI